MQLINDSLQIALNNREAIGIKRKLKNPKGKIDFYSNDYLGLAKNKSLHDLILNEYNNNKALLFGSTGARLISGNSEYVTETEKTIASAHLVEAALLFPSGYNANLGLISALATRNDVILVDEKIHRSIHDGCRLTHARKLKFNHNDLQHLELLLQKINGNCFIAVESLYSMNGDFAPLQDLTTLAKKYNAALIVDEAHAFGTFGYGLVHQLGLQKDVFATVVTYGKAMGANGAAVLGNQLLIDYLINFSSPFIYTTAIPDAHVTHLRFGYQFLENHTELEAQLQENINYFIASGIHSSSDKKSPIQIIKFEDVNRLRAVKEQLEAVSINAFIVFHPTVAKGDECLRICLHAFNTKEEINLLIKIIKNNE